MISETFLLTPCKVPNYINASWGLIALLLSPKGFGPWRILRLNTTLAKFIILMEAAECRLLHICFQAEKAVQARESWLMQNPRGAMKSLDQLNLEVIIYMHILCIFWIDLKYVYYWSNIACKLLTTGHVESFYLRRQIISKMVVSTENFAFLCPKPSVWKR